MRFEDVLGQNRIKEHLQQTVEENKVPHTQLFIGSEGCGLLPMALAYAGQILCAKDDEKALSKIDNFIHPDLHFTFPVATNQKVKSHPVSNLFLDEWRVFLKKKPYGNLLDWYRETGIENKQGQISVDEAQEIVKKLFLKPYESHYKVMIIWMVEKMNTSSANKLLKLLEEPPPNTVFLLLSENEGQILQTIRSRCQVLHFNILNDSDIRVALESKSTTSENILRIVNQVGGNYNKALDMLGDNLEDGLFGKWFVNWVRVAFSAKGDKGSIIPLMSWSEEISTSGREIQKQFISFCFDVFRQALLKNYGVSQLVYLKSLEDGFLLERFAPFIHNKNITGIFEELQKAFYHIERNGNTKVIFTDLSIKLVRLLHVK